MGSHSVTCNLIQLNTPCLNSRQMGQCLIYLPPEGSKAELTLMLVILRWLTCLQAVTHLSSNQLSNYFCTTCCRHLLLMTLTWYELVNSWRLVGEKWVSLSQRWRPVPSCLLTKIHVYGNLSFHFLMYGCLCIWCFLNLNLINVTYFDTVGHVSHKRSCSNCWWYSNGSSLSTGSIR